VPSCDRASGTPSILSGCSGQCLVMRVEALASPGCAWAWDGSYHGVDLLLVYMHQRNLKISLDIGAQNPATFRRTMMIMFGKASKGFIRVTFGNGNMTASHGTLFSGSGISHR
jgi:hypothetical protein